MHVRTLVAKGHGEAAAGFDDVGRGGETGERHVEGSSHRTEERQSEPVGVDGTARS